VLVALHVLAITLVALPAPDGGMNRAAWKDPTVQHEIHAWSARLDGLGVQIPPAELEEDAWHFAKRFMAVRHAVLRPFRRYYQFAGTWQSWRMFVAPHRYPARLQIAVRAGSAWQTVYERGDPQATWRRRQLDHDRMRAQIFRLSWPGYGGTYARFTLWIARAAAHDFPYASQVRVRFFKYRTRSPAEVRAGVPVQGRWILARTRDLQRFR